MYTHIDRLLATAAFISVFINGMGAIHDSSQGFVEFSGGFADYKTGTPGDYGWKVLTSSDPAEKTKKLSAEIANSSLAFVENWYIRRPTTSREFKSKFEGSQRSSKVDLQWWLSLACSSRTV